MGKTNQKKFQEVRYKASDQLVAATKSRSTASPNSLSTLGFDCLPYLCLQVRQGREQASEVPSARACPMPQASGSWWFVDSSLRKQAKISSPNIPEGDSLESLGLALATSPAGGHRLSWTKGGPSPTKLEAVHLLLVRLHQAAARKALI